MSLKAKIEAVIYASEEPVTLAQLTGLLGEEAQAELDALDARQPSLALDDQPPSDTPDTANPDTDPASPETLNAEVLDASTTPQNQAEPATPETIVRETELNAHQTALKALENDPKLREISRINDRRLREFFRSLLDQLIADYASDTRGLEIREVAGGFRLATKPEYHDAVRGFVKSLKPPLKLSLQALETLAVVAYKQPVTAPEISEIRGVDSTGVLGSLMARKLITTAGRKQVIGRPILYKTTRDFLLRFGLKDINELPSIEEFEKMAGELNAAVQEEISMDESSEERNSVLDERKSALQPTYVRHDTAEDLMSDKSTALEGRKHEHADPHHADPHEVEPQAGPESELRAEDGDAAETSVNMADEVIIDGRISGPPPSYADDSPSAQEASEQEDRRGQENPER